MLRIAAVEFGRIRYAFAPDDDRAQLASKLRDDIIALLGPSSETPS